MPIVDLDTNLGATTSRPEGFAVTPGQDEIDHGSDTPDPGFGQTLLSAFRQGNMVASAASRLDGDASHARDPDFNPWEAIKGTKYEPHWNSFVDIHNEPDANLRKRQLDMEEDDRRNLAAAPWYKSLPATLLAGAADLPSLLPGGAFVRGAAGGISIARSAAVTGLAAGVGAGAQELGLHASQELRTPGESATNIGMSVFLGGLLGAGGAALMSRSEWSAAVEKMGRDVAGPSPQMGEGRGEGGAVSPASVGAAAHEPVSLEDNAIAGRMAGGVAAVTKQLNPLLRLVQSPSAAVRDVAGKLFENSLYLKKNAEGVASDQAVETLMQEWNGALGKALGSTDDAFLGYRKGGGGMTRSEFREEVGRAMRRGDEHVVSEVAQVAKAWRSKVFDPLKDAAIKAGLLPQDVSVDTAQSYFSRMWNRNRLIAQEPQFKGIVADYYSDVIGKEYEKATVGLNSRTAKLNQEIEDLTLTPEQRTARLGEIETKITEHEEAGAAYQDLGAHADRLSEIAGELRRLKATGDTMVAKQNSEALRGEAKSIREAGGKDLKAFMAERTNLRARRRNVDLGAAGIAERSQAVMESLADIEEATQRSLGRLVKKGQALERELDKLDPDTLAERIGGMRESFAEMARKHDAAAERTQKAIDAIHEQAAQRAERADLGEEKEGLPAPIPARKGGASLLTFIRNRGGIAAGDQFAGDVKGLGLGRLLSKKGIPLDRLREAAVEAGYLTDEGAREGGVTTSTVNHLLDAMGEEARGNKRYIPGEEPAPRVEAKPIGGRPLGASEKGAAILDAAEAKTVDRLETHLAEQEARAERMQTIASRLDIAEGFDRDGAVAELRSAVEKAIAESSSTVLGRGERAQRLLERLAALDPKRIEERTKTIEAMKKDLERAYYDRWEIKNLGQGVDPQAKDRPDFSEAARSIADTAYNTLTGRTESGVRPEFMTVGTRGPMKDRTFNIPDKLIEDFLEHDVDHVGRRYVRVMGADVEMANKFGSVDMKDQFDAIRTNYDQLRAGITDEKGRLALGEQERADVSDLTDLRDLMRGTRAESPVERNYAKIARMAGYINYIRSMGEIVLANLGDAVRPAMVHGLMPYLQTVGHLATNMKGIKLSVEEAKLAGNVLERVLAHRMATLTDIADPYSAKGPIEAFLESMSNVASKVNGIRIWTDMQKSVAAVMTQNRILQGVERYGEHGAPLAKLDALAIELKRAKDVGDAAAARSAQAEIDAVRKSGGTALKSFVEERRYLAMIGIDQGMAEKIAKQFATHGENVDGVRVANTEMWTDPVARRAYRAAMNKDVDSTIVEASKADVPLFVHTPTGKLLLQFQTFNLAAHQRVMMRGLQESPTRFIGSTIAMTAMGMAITWLKAISANRTEKLEEISSNPGWWIGEGLDRAGVLPVPIELANRFEKMTGLNPIKAPLKAFDKGSAESQKNQNRPDFGSAFGPTFGLGQDIYTAASIPRTMIAGKDVSKAQVTAAERAGIPFRTYAGVRQIVDYVVNPYLFPH